MDKIFNIDSPLMQFLSRLADMVILNLITLLCCIPIVTAGASLTAMYYVELKWVRKEEGYTVRPFFHQFKANFKQATGEWLVMLLIAFILFMDLSLFYTNADSFPAALRLIVMGICIIVFLLIQWILPLQSHFENTVRQTMHNGFLMALANFPRTLGMGAVWAAFLTLAVFSISEIPQIFPLILLFGLSAPGYLVCLLANKPFRRLEPKSDEDKDE